MHSKYEFDIKDHTYINNKVFVFVCFLLLLCGFAHVESPTQNHFSYPSQCLQSIGPQLLIHVKLSLVPKFSEKLSLASYILRPTTYQFVHISLRSLNHGMEVGTLVFFPVVII
jgi:hypothetical protein